MRRTQILLVAFLVCAAPGMLYAQDEDYSKYPPHMLPANALSVQVEILKGELKQLQTNAELTRRQLDKLEKERDEIQGRRDEIRIRLDAAQTSHQSYGAIRISLEKQLTELEIEKAGLNAQRKEILRFAEESKARAESARRGLLAKQIEIAERILAAKMKARERVAELHKRRAVSETELIQTETDVLDAELRIEELETLAKEQSARTPEIQERLLETSIQLAMVAAQIDYINDKLLHMKKHAKSVDELEVLRSHQLPAILGEISEVRSRIRDQSRRFLIESRIHEIQSHLKSLEEEKKDQKDN